MPDAVDPTPPLPTALKPMSADVLRRLWKQRRDTYAEAHLYEEARIRVHRCLTWLAIAQERSPQQHDTQLLELWSSAGALFSRWSALLGAPLPTREATASFARQILGWDRDGTLAQALGRLRHDSTSATSFWTDPYLSRLPRDGEGNAKSAEVPAGDGEFLAGLLDRIGLTVSQLSTGSTTYGGSQNRVAVDRSVEALSQLVPAFVQVMTEHGYIDDWGALCSPPR